MYADEQTFLYKFRLFGAGLLIFATLFLVALPLSMVGPIKAPAARPSFDALHASTSDSPNVVTTGMARASDVAGGFLGSFEANATKGTNTLTNGSRLFVRGVLGGIAATGRGVGKATVFIGNAVGQGVVFVLHLPGNALKAASHSTKVAASAILRPADHTTVPIIEPSSPALLAARAAFPATKPVANTPQTDSAPVWPMRGAVTTLFGATGWPYAAAHTGIDISDSKAPGVTPVHPFRPGRVTEVISSNRSLGNHVVVDHGSGVTSVYGHLASLLVSVGQEVTNGTVLGHEGSTGFSTGTHLHFEIRVNGLAANPQQFIAGQP